VPPEIESIARASEPNMPTPSSLSFTRAWLRSTRIRRAVALSAVVLATGGLVLYRAPSSAAWTSPHAAALGKNAAAFDGPGAHGVVSLSHTKVLAGQTTPVFAEIRLTADPKARVGVRAPLALAVVLDTSGSMSGEKLEDAKRSVLRLVSDMQDDDEIAVVRYSDASSVVQPLARVGAVRSELSAHIRALDAGGGTNIPLGLSSGRRALDEAARGRVRRIVLVSDGLDGTRVQAESLASSSFSSGITVSSLGIGLDFDEAYMGGVAQSGHGNFAFIRDGGSLASFLRRELEETATTTIEDARVALDLPAGLRFVSATGADASSRGDRVELRIGSLFAGDERRVIVELAAAPRTRSDELDLRAEATWSRVGESSTRVSVPALALVASNDPGDVEGGRDGAILASATSVLASKRQLEAASAYARGDVATATRLTAQTQAAIGAAIAAAPSAAPLLDAQLNAYSAQQRGFESVAPSSAEGRAAAKAAVMKDQGNLVRKGF
jgi:Ca-activated chloride channel family protein